MPNDSTLKKRCKILHTRYFDSDSDVHDENENNEEEEHEEEIEESSDQEMSNNGTATLDHPPSCSNSCKQ